ncbi:MAG: nucleoside-diphosphate kinase [Acidobacteriota bacterium]
MNHSERTLSIVKPDAIERGQGGQILSCLEEAGLHLVAMKRLHLSRREAESFYHVHRDEPFFSSLTRFMSSGPVIVLVLEGENAITRLRDLMGATDPAKAADETLRRKFGTSIERNAIHGSDSPASAASEIAYFFSGLDLARS